jgi:hypothetical protein
MDLTEKELAFLRGIYVEPEWTSKFTELINESVVVDGFSTITYINAGAGGHAIEIADKLGEDVEVFPVSENRELREIARTKVETVGSRVDFSTEPPMGRSELVIADASFVQPSELEEFLSNARKSASRKLVFFLPTSGSFGEVFSYLWEVLLELDLLDKSGGVEDLISGLTTVNRAESAAMALDLKKVASFTKNEFLEYASGKEFLESPLVRYFLMPGWLEFLEEDQRERVVDGLAAKIDEDRKEMTFRIAVKATVVSGEAVQD